MKTLAWLLLVPVGLYLLVGALLYLQQERLLFPAPRGTVAGLERLPGIEPLVVPSGDGPVLHGALRRAEGGGPAPLILYFGGNGELASAALADPRWPRHWSVAAVEYRGYGRSEGAPSERALFADALRVHDALVQRLQLAPGQQVVAVGRSLGSGVAAWLASQRPLAGVVLVTPYDSITEVAAGLYPWLPVRYLIRHAFDSHRIAHDIRTPALFVTAGRDTLIRSHHSERLLGVWAGPKRHVDIGSADHDDVVEHDAYWRELRRFVAQTVPAAR